MAQIGSFALLLAPVSSAYCVIAGIIAIASKRGFAAPRGETARRAGIASFALVLLAAPNVGCRMCSLRLLSSRKILG
jgi:hypothetical protein